MLSYFLKKLYIIFSLSLLFTTNVFAQEKAIETLQIDAGASVLYGKIVGSQQDTELVFELSTSRISEEISGSVLWSSEPIATFSIPLSGYVITPNTLNAANNVVYDTISVKKRAINGELDPTPIQVFSLGDIIVQEAEQNKVQASWKDIELRESDLGANFYSFQSNGPVMVEKTEDIFLNIARAPLSGGEPQYITLCAFPAGASSFKVSYPECYESDNNVQKNLQKSPFVEGYSYDLFFSDTVNGKAIINESNLLVRLPEVKSFSSSPASKELDQEVVPVSSTLDPQQQITTRLGGAAFVQQTQQEILDNKIVPTDCGYNLDSGGTMCGFANFIDLIQRIIEYIFVLVLPIAAIIFAYAGFLFLTSGGNKEKRSKAKSAMTHLIGGVIIVMSAWLIVKTILVALGVPTDASWFYLSVR
jgi:hypothetical protein